MNQPNGARGMTLIEVVVSLSILSGILVAGTMWIQVVSNDLSKTAADRDLMIAERTLDAIVMAILTGDFLLKDEQESREPRIEVSSDAITISTRSPGIGVIQTTFFYDGESETIGAKDQYAGESPTRVVAHNIKECTFEKVEHADRASIVRIEVVVGHSPPLLRETAIP